MSTLLELGLNQFLVFVLVLTRIAPLMMMGPLYGSKAIPRRIRVLLALSLALIITPVHWSVPIEDPGNVFNLAVMIGREAVVGFSFTLAVVILFAGLQITGQMIGQMSGMSLADIFDPTFNTSVPVFARILDLVTLTVFILIGGHRMLMSAVLDTFQWMPPGHVTFSYDVVQAISDVMTQSFALGIRAGAPVLVALLLSVLIMGLISRTLPQLNILAIGFSFNAIVTLVILSVSIGAAAWLFQDEAVIAIESIQDALSSSQPRPKS